MLEQQIYSIEAANINQETLAAMKNAGEAMKKIHGKMTLEDVDKTVYANPPFRPTSYPSGLSQPSLSALFLFIPQVYPHQLC